MKGPGIWWASGLAWSKGLTQWLPDLILLCSFPYFPSSMSVHRGARWGSRSRLAPFQVHISSQETQQQPSLSLASCSHHQTNHSGMNELTGQNHRTEPFPELKHMYLEQGRNWMPWTIQRCLNQKKEPGRGAGASPKRNVHWRMRINPLIRKRLCMWERLKSWGHTWRAAWLERRL